MPEQIGTLLKLSKKEQRKADKRRNAHIQAQLSSIYKLSAEESWYKK